MGLQMAGCECLPPVPSCAVRVCEHTVRAALLRAGLIRERGRAKWPVAAGKVIRWVSFKAPSCADRGDKNSIVSLPYCWMVLGRLQNALQAVGTWSEVNNGVSLHKSSLMRLGKMLGWNF